MELIMMQNSLFESQQYINWAKLFYSAKLFAEGQTVKAVEELIKDWFMFAPTDALANTLHNVS